MHPESTPVIVSINTPGGNGAVGQKKTWVAGVPRPQTSPVLVVSGGIVKVWHTVTLLVKFTTLISNAAACTGIVFSAIPPIDNVNETMMPRHSLKKPTIRRSFPKFDVLISLPPYLLLLKEFIFPFPAK
jgi:hypothetical protein